MQHYCTIQELLAVVPLNDAGIAGGWKGRSRAVGRVLSLEQSLAAQDLACTVVLIDQATDKASDTDIEAILHSSAAGVIITGQSAAVSRQWAEAADAAETPLILSAGGLDESELALRLDLIRSIKAAGKMTDFAQVPSGWLKGELQVLLDKAGAYLLSRMVVVDPNFRTVAKAGFEEAADRDSLTALLRAVQLEYLERSQKDGEFCVVSPTAGSATEVGCNLTSLRRDKTLLGFLLAFPSGAGLNELDKGRIRQVALLCSRELDTRKQVEEVEKRYKSHFVFDLLYNNFESEELLIQRGRQLGWDFTRPQQLLVMEPHDFQPAHKKAALFEQLQQTVSRLLQAEFRQAIVFEQLEQLVVIIPMQDGEKNRGKLWLTEWAQSLKRRVEDRIAGIGLSIGIGRTYPSIADLSRSYQEAKQALELGRYLQDKGHITHFEALGIMHLLSHISLETLDDFYKECLGAILEYDERNGTNFLETLQEYFQQNADFNLTAEKLFMHSNTLRNRLKKIEELLELDLQKLENRVNLSVACKIARMRQTTNR